MATRLGLVIVSGQTQQVQAGDALGARSGAGGGLDVLTAGALNIGVTTATSIDVGAVGILTTIKGNLQVDGTETVIGTTTFNGNVNLGDNSGDAINIGGGTTDVVTLKSNLLLGAGLVSIGTSTAQYASEIWIAEVAGSAGNAAVNLNATATTAAGSHAIGVNTVPLTNIAPANADLQAVLVAINTAIGTGSAQSLDDVMTNSGTHALDNDVTIPTTKEVVYNDGGVNLSAAMFTLTRTGASATKDIISISGSGASGWGTGATIVYGINMSITPTGGTTTNARGINLTMGAGTGTGITVTQNSSVAQAVLLNNTTGNNNDCLLISGGQFHMNSGAGRFLFEGLGDFNTDMTNGGTTKVTTTLNDNVAAALLIQEAANAYITIDTTNAAERILFNKNIELSGAVATLAANGASSFTTSAGALTFTAAAASTWKTSGGALTVDSATALNLGTTDATSVSVSRTGVTTTVNGALTVAELTSLNGDTDIGNATTDTLTVTAQIDADVFFVAGTSATARRFRKANSTVVGQVPGGIQLLGAASAAADGATNAAKGGAASTFAGAGGAASATNLAGAGGNANLLAGDGGAASAANPGATGGETHVSPGIGGAATATANAGDGGFTAIIGGNGGLGTGAGEDGNGGAITIYAGNAGAANIGSHDGGSVFLDGGASNGTGVGGTIEVGVTNVSAVNLGLTTVPVTSKGPFTANEGVASPATVNGTTSIDAGEAVAMSNDGGAARAFKADHSATGTLSNGFGIARYDAATSATVEVVVAGIVDVPDAQWDAVPAATAGGQRVYGSPTTPGNLTTTAPTTLLQVVQKLGIIHRGGSGAVQVLVQPADSVLL